MRVHAFVLMGNHFHLMASTPRAPVDECMEYFQSQLSREIGEYLCTQIYRFGGRYQWSILGDETGYWNVLKYILRNPVKAGLVERCRDYKFLLWPASDWKFQLDPSEYHFPPHFFDWIEKPENPELLDLIRKGLRRTTFRIHIPLKLRDRIDARERTKGAWRLWATTSRC